MLRKTRITLALIFFIAITALFLDFTGTIHAWLGWTAKMQVLPALLATNLVVVVTLIVLTMLVGRIYCSVICPLGVFQDIVSKLNSLRKKKKNRFIYSKEKKWLRYSLFAIFVVSLIMGLGSIVALLAPYSAYGRIVSNIFAPIYQCGNNLLAIIAERADSYSLYSTDIWIRSIATFIIALATMIVIILLAWKNGRTYCNTICPIGTFLSLFARFSFFRPTISTDKCKNCSLCSRRCKASCIDYKDHTIDYSRCVACMDCIDNCKHHAITLQLRNKATHTTPQPTNENIDKSRRNFITTTAVLATTTAIQAQEKKVDGGLAIIEDKQIPKRTTPIVPPGAWSARGFAQHCTGCQLCVSVCPNNVLRPSTELDRLMQPEMSYERGYCRPECTRCSEVCPAGAIKPISVADKSSTRIGHAVWVKKNCIPLTDGVNCGNCARHCPSGAILMVPSDPHNEDSVKIPVVNTERCIGCGACENLCPARPFSAIYVEGHTMHSIM